MINTPHLICQKFLEALHNYAPSYKSVVGVNWIGESQYHDGSAALQAELVWDDGFPETSTLSVNLSQYGFVTPPGYAVIRDYSEHGGLPDALEAAGVAIKEEEVSIGFGSGWLMKIVTTQDS